MAILTTFTHTGDPDAMLKLAEEKLLSAARQAGAEGQISSTVLRTDEGIMIVNLWETEEGMRRAAEIVGPVAHACGLPPQQDWQMCEVIRHAHRHD
jgi:hypothetical protein